MSPSAREKDGAFELEDVVANKLNHPELASTDPFFSFSNIMSFSVCVDTPPHNASEKGGAFEPEDVANKWDHQEPSVKDPFSSFSDDMFFSVSVGTSPSASEKGGAFDLEDKFDHNNWNCSFVKSQQ